MLAWPFVAAVEAYALVGRLGRQGSRPPRTRHGARARHAGAFFFVARKP